MNLCELKPTYDNLLRTYKDDTIGRKKDIQAFAEILNSITDSCSIAVDGEWGCGKTFFVKQTKLFIDAQNTHIKSINEDEKNVFISTDVENFKDQVTVYYDAWENDNDNDPILSLIYSILRDVDTAFEFKETSIIDIAVTILESFTGKNYQDIIQKLRGENPLEEIRKIKNIDNNIHCFLNSLLEEKGERLIVFIDELDRCKPSYAVSLLERIKHYFDNDRITFVFSTNIKELQHTIKRFYGENFDAYRYLDKFFNLRLTIPPVDIKKYLNSIDFEDYYAYDKICLAVIKYYKFSIREMNKYISMAKLAAYKPTHNSRKYNFVFPDEKGKLFCIIHIVPIMLGLMIYNLDEYENFINGRNSAPFIEILSGLEDYIFEQLLDENETFNDTIINKKFVRLEDKLDEIYDTVFNVLDKENINHINIGKYTFTKNIKKELLKISSLLSEFKTID